MKNVITTTILAAATLAISVSPALAQAPNKLKAEIPFSFRIGSQVYEAGSYEASMVALSVGGKYLRMTNRDTNHGGLALIQSPIAKNGTDKDYAPRLVFQCNGSDCTLSQVWTGNGESGAQLKSVAPKTSDHMRIAVVRLLPTSAD